MIHHLPFLLIPYLLLLVILQKREIKQLQKSSKTIKKTTAASNILGATKRHKTTHTDKSRQFEKPMSKTAKFVENKQQETTQSKVSQEVYDPQEIYPMEDDKEDPETQLTLAEQEEVNSLFREEVITDVDTTLTKRELLRMQQYLQKPTANSEQAAFVTYKKIATTEFVETLVADYTQESKRKLQEWQQKINNEEQETVKVIPPEKQQQEFDIYKYINP